MITAYWQHAAAAAAAPLLLLFVVLSSILALRPPPISHAYPPLLSFFVERKTNVCLFTRGRAIGQSSKGCCGEHLRAAQLTTTTSVNNVRQQQSSPPILLSAAAAFLASSTAAMSSRYPQVIPLSSSKLFALKCNRRRTSHDAEISALHNTQTMSRSSSGELLLLARPLRSPEGSIQPGDKGAEELSSEEADGAAGPTSLVETTSSGGIEIVEEVDYSKVNVIVLTDAALNRIKDICKDRTKLSADGLLYLRMGVKSGGCSGLSYSLDIIKKEDISSQVDRVERHEGFACVVDYRSLMYLFGMQLDYSDTLIGGGFKFSNPNASRSCGCGMSFGVPRNFLQSADPKHNDNRLLLAGVSGAEEGGEEIESKPKKCGGGGGAT
eukprot:GHVS01059787.1.p1 GENE.GHVS01059787.1~~GHVS01059787.1.p1  ORF type:complete len:381 (-),score=83.67 GHVS01059787.1:718-1860(-)